MKETVPPNSSTPGFLADVYKKFRLMLRLMTDHRIGWHLKLIPLGTLVYLVIPLDFLFGPIDDAVVIYAGMELFIQLCPQDIVQEHIQSFSNKDTQSQKTVIDAKFQDKQE